MAEIICYAEYDLEAPDDLKLWPTVAWNRHQAWQQIVEKYLEDHTGAAVGPSSRSEFFEAFGAEVDFRRRVKMLKSIGVRVRRCKLMTIDAEPATERSGNVDVQQ